MSSVVHFEETFYVMLIWILNCLFFCTYILSCLHPSRRARRLLSRSQLRHACRQPCEQITLRRVSQGPPQGLVLAPPHPHPSLRMRGPIVIHDWSDPPHASCIYTNKWSPLTHFNPSFAFSPEVPLRILHSSLLFGNRRMWCNRNFESKCRLSLTPTLGNCLNVCTLYLGAHECMWSCQQHMMSLCVVLVFFMDEHSDRTLYELYVNGELLWCFISLYEIVLGKGLWVGDVGF